MQDGVSTLHVEISNDHGGQSDKTTISIRDCEKPASFKRQSPLATSEPLHQDGKKPNGSASNFKKVFTLADGFADLNGMSVVRIGDQFAVIPSTTVPSFPLGALPDVVISKADLPPIPPGAAERLALRSDAPEKLATLVRTSADGPAVGIRAGDLFVPLRADVPAPDIIDQEVYHLDVFFCSDLLATATCVGCDNMASCCCCWCRGDFNEIEKKGDYLTHDK